MKIFTFSHRMNIILHVVAGASVAGDIYDINFVSVFDDICDMKFV